MRRKGRSGLVCVLVALGVAGCTSSTPVKQATPAKHPTSGGDRQSARPTSPVITESEAQSLLSDMTQKNNQANSACDSTLLGQFEDEAQFRLDDAVYRVCRALDPQHKDPIKPFQYGSPAFYRPAAADGGQWFLATATVGSKQVAVVFARQAADQPWKAVASPGLTTVIPPLAKDASGNPVAVPASDASTLVASPQDVAAKQAAYLTTGSAAPEATMFAPDTHFDEIINDQQVRSHLQFASAQAGGLVPADRITRQVTVERYPVRALRTADGGAVAFYTTKWQLIAEKAQGVVIFKGGDNALAGGQTFHDRVTISWLSEWAVRIPPKGGGTVTVLGAETDKENISS